jgi:hypothetical protein
MVIETYEGDHSWFCLSCLGSLVFLFPKNLSYLAFQSIDNEHSCWRLFQKSVKCIQLDIYLFIYIVNIVQSSWKTEYINIIDAITDKKIASMTGPHATKLAEETKTIYILPVIVKTLEN